MPAVQTQPPATSSPVGPRPRPDEEREFIRGNRDGAKRTNDTYTVCRLRVSQERLENEMKLGLHSHFLSLAKCWECPAHIFLKAAKMKRERLGVGTSHPPPTVVPLDRWQSSGLVGRQAEAVEIIQRDPDRSGDATTFTICRVAVPRERMVLEVMAGLHPGYHVSRKKSRDSTEKNGDNRYVRKNPAGAPHTVDYPERQWACNDFYVQGNPTEPFDNVDFPKSRQAKPGFGPRDLCPFRLLEPGSRIAM